MVTFIDAGCDVLGKAAGDVELLRQHVILHLLRRVPMGPDALCTAVQQLLQCGVLTKDVLPELSLPGLCLDLVREIPAPLQPAGTALAPVPAWPHLAAPGLLGRSSRFEQEFDRVELLGRGAFGEVWRCRHRLDGREYAVKSVHYHASEADHIEHRILREARTWASMDDHPHVARYHSAWVEAAQHALAPPGHHPSAGSLALPLPPESARAADTLSSIAFTADQSDDEVTFREESNCPSRSGQLAVPLPLSAILEQEPRAAVEAVPAAGGILARRSRPQDARAARGGPSPGAAGGGRGAVLFIQSELCGKDTLGTWIAKRNAAWASGATPPRDRVRWVLEACRIFQECASAVAHLHAQRCVHRDLKPTNVLFAHDGAVRLGDFGLAKVVGAPLALEDGGPRPRARGSLPPGAAAPSETRGVGTPAYASPEQLAGGACGVKADVYALGVMLVELLTPVDTQMERVALLEGLRLGRWTLAGVLPQTWSLAAAMTSREPEGRPTAEEVLRAFAECALEAQRHFAGRSMLGPAAPSSEEGCG